jgi:hypothetical protein
MKFIRKCQLQVETLDGRTVTIPEQLTIEFDILRAHLASSQQATFRIKNLSERTRGLIYHDPYQFDVYRLVQFRAGFEGDPTLALAFSGRIMSAVSYRKGTEFITEIQAYDGGLDMSNGHVALPTVIGELSVKDLLTQLAKELPRTSAPPIIGDFPDIMKRGAVRYGNTWDLIFEYSGHLATIDNGQVKILNYDEAIDAGLLVISPESGLLDSPRRGTYSLSFRTLFEPRLILGQIIVLKSVTNPQFNRDYRVTSIHHTGTISPAVAGDCYTEIDLFFSTGFKKLPNVPIA